MRQRVISSIIGIPLLIAIFLIGPKALQAAWLGIIAIILSELTTMVYGKLDPVNFMLAIGLLGIFSYNDAYLAPALSGYLIITLIYNIIVKNQYPLSKIVLAISGVVYITMMAYLFTPLLAKGFKYIIICLVLAWSYDTCAYLTGRKWGKRRPWPKLSPKKSIEGVIGGAICSILITSTFGLVNGFTLPSLILFAMVGVFIAQSGDLIESAFKRECGVKDAGRIMPGHGGLWDRFDSVLPIIAWANLIFVVIGL